MLEKEEIQRIERTFSALKKAENDVAALEAEMNMVKKQAKEIFEKYNLKGFSDVSKLEALLKEREEQLLKMEEDAKTFISEVNKVKEEKENILLG